MTIILVSLLIDYLINCMPFKAKQCLIYAEYESLPLKTQNKNFFSTCTLTSVLLDIKMASMNE